MQSLGGEVLNGCDNSWGSLDTCHTETEDAKSRLQVKREETNGIMF